MPYPYLKDPEEPLSTWSEPIYAFHNDEAEQKCQSLSIQYNVDLVDVVRVSKTCYHCIFSG